VFISVYSGTADVVHCQGWNHLFPERSDVDPGSRKPGGVSLEQKQDDY